MALLMVVKRVVKRENLLADEMVALMVQTKVVWKGRLKAVQTVA